LKQLLQLAPIWFHKIDAFVERSPQRRAGRIEYATRSALAGKGALPVRRSRAARPGGRLPLATT
jgi:hypothetical protein